MKSVVAVLLALATLSISAANASPACDAFANSDAVAKFEAKYALLATMPYSLWDDYRPETHTVILTSLKTNADCAVVLKAGTRTDVLTLDLPLTMGNGLYDFQFIGGNEHPGIQNFLRTTGVPRVLLLNLDGTKLAIPEPNAIRMGYNHFDLDLTVHEGFHLNLMFAKMFKHPGAGAWPEWDHQPSRDKLGGLCYSSPKAKPLFDIEMKALVRAVKLALVDRRPDLAINAGREFIQRRAERYAALADVRVPSHSVAEGISCAQAEAIMELEEGMADFLGVGTIHKLGLINDSQALEHVAVDSGDSSFYRFGSGQMLLVHALKGAEISEITGRIARSKSWEDGVHAEFKKALE